MRRKVNRNGIVVGPHDPVKREQSRRMRRDPTPAENALWQCLRRSQCAGVHFRRQQIIDGFLADFYCHRAGLIIELDGPIHEQQCDYDATRDAILARRGLRIIRITNEEILQNLDQVLERIRDVVTDLGTD